MRRSILALFIAPTLVAAVHAVAGGPVPAHSQPMSRSATACEAARLAAWFDAQRQLTDGNTDPTKPIATPVECIQKDGRADAGSTIRDNRRIVALPPHAEQERETSPGG